MAQPQKNNPSDFLKQVLGRPVVVKLNSGVDYRGVAPACSRIASGHSWTRGAGVSTADPHCP